ncbi:MAG TPA: nucleotidyltransferase domain-containing protein [Anaerolineales bacterium]|nr:nucleotidyltransferase domain-containing protein [Anaerolineales bacterium]
MQEKECRRMMPQGTLSRFGIMGIKMEKISQRTISSFARQVARQFNPQMIILFGSYAYGKPTEDSDVDILVVMPFKGPNPEKATEIWMAPKPRFPIDIMVRKSAELKKTIGDGGLLLARDHGKRQSAL